MCCSSLLPRDQTHVTITRESLYCTWTQAYNQDQDPAADCPLIYSICMDFSICYFQYMQPNFLCSKNHYAIQLFFSGKYRFSWASQPPINQKYTLNLDESKTSSHSEEIFCTLHCMNKGCCIKQPNRTHCLCPCEVRGRVTAWRVAFRGLSCTWTSLVTNQ